MTKKAFWSEARVGVIGGGAWGTVLAHVVAPNCGEVRLWTRETDVVRDVNSTRSNSRYAPGLALHPRVKAFGDAARVFEGGLEAVIWVLPSQACREQARAFARHFTGEEILLHAAKGVEEGSLKRMSEVLREELPCARIGVISGPNLSKEIADGQPAATVVASRFDEVHVAGRALLSGPRFLVETSADVVGVEWAGVLKNILAIAAGAIDAAGLGWNARAMLISRGLEEMTRFGVAMGGEPGTFIGLAGVGDLLATCGSSLSRNFRVGHRLARGEKMADIQASLGSTAEGVRAAQAIWKFAQARDIHMPLTEGVYRLTHQGEGVESFLATLAAR